ncbi:hypothetical protein DB32_005187 [Sandaracinus amylolyticus]|uniref:Uncharacterized protein n=1 Tax=Sandaracinus amylolyticus TaxID=927083 RepID=A0A0F6YJP3_9BACT|nr:hypothetical protein DB32_005187 [Sandaracinus amylolyticus]
MRGGAACCGGETADGRGAATPGDDASGAPGADMRGAGEGTVTGAGIGTDSPTRVIGAPSAPVENRSPHDAQN